MLVSGRAPPRAVVLDLDGTLVDSKDAHVRCWVEALRARGIAIAPERVRPLVGMGADRILPRLTGIPADSPLGRRIGEARATLFRLNELAGIRPFPRVRELLERMRRDGLRVAVASSSARRDLDAVLERSGVEDLLDARVSAEDADQSQPGPALIEAALARLGVPPPEALALGDTPYDVAAASRAGVGAVALRCGGWSDRDLEGAIAIYDDPADLLSRYDGSPLSPVDRESGRVPA